MEDGDDGVDVIYSGEDCDAVDGFRPVLYYAHFCEKCAAKWKDDGLLFDNQDDARAWLSSQSAKQKGKAA
jgi:hypothetical protein